MQATLPGFAAPENNQGPKADRDDFEKLWGFCRRGSKKRAWEQYRRKVPERVGAEDLQQAWAAYVDAQYDHQAPDGKRCRFVCHLFRWLRDERWEEWLERIEGSRSPTNGKRVPWGNGAGRFIR